MSDPYITAHDILAGDGRSIGCKLCRRFAWLGLFMLHSDGQNRKRFETACTDQYALRYGDSIEVTAIARNVLGLVWDWWATIEDYDQQQHIAAELRAAIKASEWPN